MRPTDAGSLDRGYVRPGLTQALALDLTRSGAFRMSGGGMERCTRCGGRTHMRYERHGLTLYLCLAHVAEHGAGLREAGWFAYRIAEKVSR